MMDKVIVVKTPTEAGMPYFEYLRDLIEWDWFDFPPVGTVCEVNNSGLVIYGRYGICDIETALFNRCFMRKDRC